MSRRIRRALTAVAIIAAVGIATVGIVTAVEIGTAATSSQQTAGPPDPVAGTAVTVPTIAVPVAPPDAGLPIAPADPTLTSGLLADVEADPAGEGFVVGADPDSGRDYGALPPSIGETAPATPDQAAAAWPAPPVDPGAQIAVAVAAAEQLGVHEAVVVVDRQTGAVLADVASDEPFPALSLVKLMIAADVLTGSGSDLPAGPTTRAWLQEMISLSDDVTAADFYQQDGADELVDRVILRFGLTGSSPTPDGEYWGNVQTSAADMATLVGRLLVDPATASVVVPAMVGTTAIAADGVDQRFGMRSVPGAGSKQGWGCCLSGVVGIHSVGFTADRIVVVLSSAETDDEGLAETDGLALQADPGAQVSIAAVTSTVRAALGAPGS